MKPSKEQLIDALVREWEYLCHDDYDPEDSTPEEYRKELEDYTYDELIDEACIDEDLTLDEYIKTWSNTN